MSLLDLLRPPLVKTRHKGRVVRASLSPAQREAKEREAQYQKQWHEDNKATRNAQRRARYLANRDEVLKQQNKWRAQNREKYNAYMRAYMRERYWRKKTEAGK